MNRMVENMNARALEYVPVRQMYERTRRRSEVPRVIVNRIALRSRRRADTQRNYILQQFRKQAFNRPSQMAQFQRSRPHMKYIDVKHRALPDRDFPQRLDRRGNPVTQRRIRGHANSQFPVVHGASEGELVFGDLRRVNRKGRYASTVDSIPVLVSRGGKAYDLLPLEETSLRPQLTTRAKHDMKRGRGIIQRPRTVIKGRKQPREFQYGGALLHSIKPEYADPDDEVMEARLTAGGPDAPYARFQEFGTRHNRAQPFMRPAFYESGGIQFRQRLISAFRVMR